jgi:hypothetical protein
MAMAPCRRGFFNGRALVSIDLAQELASGIAIARSAGIVLASTQKV